MGNALTKFLQHVNEKIGDSEELRYSLTSCARFYSIYASPIEIIPIWKIHADRKARGAAEPVDLGLSVMWASHNLGAPCPEQPGYYVGFADAPCCLQSTYYDDYPCVDNISGTKYDAARKFWQETWRIPTPQEMMELMQKCQWMWTQVNGVTGFQITGKTGNSIFLPAGGDRYGQQYEDAYYFGRYWCDKLDEQDNARAYILEFSQTSGQLFTLSRCMGMLIRPVLG